MSENFLAVVIAGCTLACDFFTEKYRIMGVTIEWSRYADGSEFVAVAPPFAPTVVWKVPAVAAAPA